MKDATSYDFFAERVRERAVLALDLVPSQRCNRRERASIRPASVHQSSPPSLVQPLAIRARVSRHD